MEERRLRISVEDEEQVRECERVLSMGVPYDRSNLGWLLYILVCLVTAILLVGSFLLGWFLMGWLMSR